MRVTDPALFLGHFGVRLTDFKRNREFLRRDFPEIFIYKEERVRGSVLNGLESHLVFTPNYRMCLISWHEWAITWPQQTAVYSTQSGHISLMIPTLVSSDMKTKCMDIQYIKDKLQESGPG